MCCAAPRGGGFALGRPGVETGPHACHCMCCAAPRGGGFALGRPGSALVRGKEHADGDKTQPEPGLQQRPRVGRHDQRAGQQQDLRPGPALAREPQQRDRCQHQDGALRRHAPTAEEGVGGGQQHTPQQRRAGRRLPEAERARASPGPAQQQRGEPGKHGDVQARNRHQVRHAGGPENIPVCALDGVLITHHQRRNQTRIGTLSDALKNPVAHALTQALHRMPAALFKTMRRRVARPRAHIAGGLQTLLPEPEFVVKAEGIAAAVGRLQPHRHLPALAGDDRRRLALQRIGSFDLGVDQIAGIPAQIDMGWKANRPAIELRRLDVKTKSQTGLVVVRHR